MGLQRFLNILTNIATCFAVKVHLRLSINTKFTMCFSRGISLQQGNHTSCNLQTNESPKSSEIINKFLSFIQRHNITKYHIKFQIFVISRNEIIVVYRLF